MNSFDFASAFANGETVEGLLEKFTAQLTTAHNAYEKEQAEKAKEKAKAAEKEKAKADLLAHLKHYMAVYYPEVEVDDRNSAATLDAAITGLQGISSMKPLFFHATGTPEEVFNKFFEQMGI